MTYCVGLKLRAGLVLLSDTRTNAGVDNIARFRKMFIFEEPGERVVALMTAGNLGVTQGVVNSIAADVKRAKIDPEVESVMTCESMYRAAQLVGEAMQEVQKRDRAHIETQGSAGLGGASMAIMGSPLREARESFEREYLKIQIRRFSGNISRTASFIGMERSALHRKLKALGLGEKRDEE